MSLIELNQDALSSKDHYTNIFDNSLTIRINFSMGLNWAQWGSIGLNGAQLGSMGFNGAHKCPLLLVNKAHWGSIRFNGAQTWGQMGLIK